MTTSSPAEPGAHGARGVPALLAAAALVGFDGGALGFVLPGFRAATGADAATASAVVWVYVLGTLVAIALGGWASSHASPARLLRAGLVLALGGALGAALGPNPLAVAAARGVQGLGQGALLPLAATLIAARWPAARQGRLNGALAMGYGLAYVGATLLAPLLLGWGGWRAAFMASAALAAVALLGSLRLPAAAPAPRPPGEPVRRWWRGRMLAVMALAAGTGVGQAVLVWLPTVAQLRLGVSAGAAAGLMVPMLLGGLLATVLLTAWLDRIGPPRMLAGGALLCLAGVALVGLWAPAKAVFAAGGGALGLGVAILCGAPLRVLAAQARPGAAQGRAQAAVALATNVGLLAGTLLLGWVSATAADDRQGVERALAVAGAVMLPAFAVLATFRRRSGAQPASN